MASQTSLKAPLKILRLEQVPVLLFRALVTSITVVGIILHHSTLILINSRRKALKFLAALRTNFSQRCTKTAVRSWKENKQGSAPRTQNTQSDSIKVKLFIT